LHKPPVKFWDIPELNQKDAAQLADEIVDMMIDALRRDPANPPLSYQEWSIALANTRQGVSKHLHRRINGHVHRDDVLDILNEAEF
jgi:hypothetical protein